LFRTTGNFFSKNAKFSNCYEKTINDVFENLNLSFPCPEHNSELLAMSIHYYVVMRMRQFEREQNCCYKKKSSKKNKEAKLCAT
jgi:hypothetical protein